MTPQGDQIRKLLMLQQEADRLNHRAADTFVFWITIIGFLMLVAIADLAYGKEWAAGDLVITDTPCPTQGAEAHQGARTGCWTYDADSERVTVWWVGGGSTVRPVRDFRRNNDGNEVGSAGQGAHGTETIYRGAHVRDTAGSTRP